MSRRRDSVPEIHWRSPEAPDVKGTKPRRALRRIVVFGMISLAVTCVGVASASWLTSALGSGRAAAQNVSAGNPPTVQAVGSTVTVSWSASTLSGGGPVEGYQVKRYNSSNVLQTIGANCAGTVAGLTCTESSVPNGDWKYSVTPVKGGWSGAESPKTDVTVVAPTVTSVSPSSRGQGATSQNVAITGTNYQSGATASFSGTGITVNSTTFNSSTQITANITVAGNATTGARNVTVTNTDSGVGSCTGCFTVNAGPTVSSTSPSSRPQGATSQNIAITGTNFVSGANATFSGTGITVNSTTFNSSTQVTANITIAGGATVGTRDVTVTNTDSGVGSCTGCFTVNALPTVTSTSPSSRGQGATSQNIAITGTNFQSGANATFSGTGITVNSTTFNSATQVTANISIATGATTGARNVTVTNPDTGSASCTGCFTVNVGPTTTSMNPSSGSQGAGPGDGTVTGTNFVSGATVSFSGTGITVNSTTFNSATQLTVNATIAQNAATGARDVIVTNPDGGRGTCTGCFTVVAGPTVTSTNPSSRGQGATNQNIAITGTNFANGAIASFSGTGITVNSTTFNSSTQVTANITVAGNATTGARNVTVTNLNTGNGSCTGCFTVNPAPTVTSTSPSSSPRNTTLTVTVIGTNFQSGATVSFNSNKITVNTVTFTDSSHLSVNITIANGGGAVGLYTVTATNPDAGTGSCTNCFQVT